MAPSALTTNADGFVGGATPGNGVDGATSPSLVQSANPQANDLPQETPTKSRDIRSIRDDLPLFLWLTVSRSIRVVRWPSQVV